MFCPGYNAPVRCSGVNIEAKILLRILALCLGLSVPLPPCSAQQSEAAQEQETGSTVTLPAGTKILLTLTQPVPRSARPEDIVYLRVSFPVVFQSKTVISPEVYGEGAIEQIAPRRGSQPAAFKFHLVKLVLPNGSPLPVSENSGIAPPSSAATFANKRSTKLAAAVIGVNAGIGALLGASLSNGSRGTGAIAGGALGAGIGAVTLQIAKHSKPSFAAGEGAEVTLQKPFTVDLRQVGVAHPSL